MIDSFKNNTIEINKKISELSKSYIDPDRRIDLQKEFGGEKSKEAFIDPDKRIVSYQENTAEKKAETLEINKYELLTTSEERIEMAKHSDGIWKGDPGNSLFIPNNADARKALNKYGQEGIEYRDGIPDFSKVSEATVTIDNMTSKIYDNYRQADIKCADQWNLEAKDGRTDWKPQDIRAWREKNHYSWHERSDRKTMDLAQGDVHGECKHFGGRAECRRAEKAESANGGFDDE